LAPLPLNILFSLKSIRKAICEIYKLRWDEGIMIKIMVDSTCDLSYEFIEKYDIKVLPLRVSIEDRDYLDKKTIQVEDVYSAMRKGIVPKTSQPNPKDIYDFFSEYCTSNKDFIYLSFSSLLSGTYQLSQSILQEFKNKYPRINMKVIDSKGGSAATGLIALQAAKLCEEKEQTFDTIVKKVQELVTHVEHVFTIADLNWLIKGGRIGKAQGVIGNMLDIKPILQVNNGAMEVIKKVRGKKKALNTVVDILEERAKNFMDQVIGVSHADDLETAEELIEIIKRRLGYKDFMVSKIGSVLGSHLGIGGVGIFFFNKGAISLLKD
jgi:DegV family protein with EDD domain